MKFKSKELKTDLITKRCIGNDMSMDEACKEIGISKATLSRLEKSKMPDVETLGKVCAWLGTTPNEYFENIRPAKHIDEIYKDWCGVHHTVNSCHPVHDSAECCDFAEYYEKQMHGR